MSISSLELYKTIRDTDPHRRFYKSIQIAARPRVLLVDDSAESVEPLNIVFSELDCDVTNVFSGMDAVLAFSEIDYDLIIMDWTLGEMNGGQAINEIHWRFAANSHQAIKHFRMNSPLPIVTYSAKKFEEIHIKPLKYFEHVEHWRKPIQFHSLASKACRVLSRIEKDII